MPILEILEQCLYVAKTVLRFVFEVAGDDLQLFLKLPDSLVDGCKLGLRINLTEQEKASVENLRSSPRLARLDVGWQPWRGTVNC